LIDALLNRSFSGSGSLRGLCKAVSSRCHGDILLRSLTECTGKKAAGTGKFRYDPEELANDAAAHRHGKIVANELAMGRASSPDSYVAVTNADGVEVHRIYLTPSRNS
jgi:hypothetical protein